MLEIKDVHKSFGGLKAVDGCSLSVKKGAITGLIGPNGAGKTTLFNVITGHYKPDEGSILFEDQELGGLAPHQIFGKKLYRTFQITREFAQMSVLENLMIMPEGQIGEKFWNTWFKLKGIKQIDRSQERVCRIPFRRPEKTIGTGPQHDGRS
jgi:branched-chain amino acid transport system ATP-binding protein